MAWFSLPFVIGMGPFASPWSKRKVLYLLDLSYFFHSSAPSYLEAWWLEPWRMNLEKSALPLDWFAWVWTQTLCVQIDTAGSFGFVSFCQTCQFFLLRSRAYDILEEIRIWQNTSCIKPFFFFLNTNDSLNYKRKERFLIHILSRYHMGSNLRLLVCKSILFSTGLYPY